MWVGGGERGLLVYSICNEFDVRSSLMVFFITQILAYTGNEDGRKFFLDGDVTLDKIKVVSLSLTPFLCLSVSH